MPLLVEANIQSIINAEMAPIEENVKRLVVDIVRRCQSTVARNFEQMKGMRSGANNFTRSSGQSFAMAQTTEEAVPRSQIGLPDSPQPPMLFNEEPPHMAMDTVPASVGQSHETVSGPSQETQFFDSGYGSSFDLCSCNCHFSININETTNSMAVSISSNYYSTDYSS